MFPRRFFAGDYFAVTFFPIGGGVTPPTPGAPILLVEVEFMANVGRMMCRG